MNSSVLRQIKDIQHQANKLSKGATNTVEIENFAKYSAEIKEYLQLHVTEPEILKYVNQIPEVAENKVTVQKGLLAILIPNIFLHWYYEKSYIDEAKNQIAIFQAKYASIEFLLKNY